MLTLLSNEMFETKVIEVVAVKRVKCTCKVCFSLRKCFCLFVRKLLCEKVSFTKQINYLQGVFLTIT